MGPWQSDDLEYAVWFFFSFSMFFFWIKRCCICVSFCSQERSAKADQSKFEPSPRDNPGLQAPLDFMKCYPSWHPVRNNCPSLSASVKSTSVQLGAFLCAAAPSHFRYPSFFNKVCKLKWTKNLNPFITRKQIECEKIYILQQTRKKMYCQNMTFFKVFCLSSFKKWIKNVSNIIFNWSFFCFLYALTIYLKSKMYFQNINKIKKCFYFF